MTDLPKTDRIPSENYRPEQLLCPICQHPLTRSHLLWRKHVTFSTGVKRVSSWVYDCPQANCPGAHERFTSRQAETLHLKYRRFSRELVVKIGYRRFWHHQTMYEIYDWLHQDLQLVISAREVMHLIADFLALLKAGQGEKIRHALQALKGLVISIDGMQPEKGNDCLYIVRELQCGVTLLAVNLEESSQEALCDYLFAPLKALAQEFELPWHGVVSDAQETIRLAVAKRLPGTPHQACQAHCLREAGKLTFEADRAMKKDLKASFRQALPRLHKRIQALPVDDPFRPILLDYRAAIRSVLPEGGVAPFALGGIRVFEALEDLGASVIRCQKKGSISSCVGSLHWRNTACLSPPKWPALGDSGNGSLTWSAC